MTAIMLHDTDSAYDMNYVVLRHFNVAGADPPGRIGLGSASAVQGELQLATSA
jgi:UDP-glucose 4-epimerase